VGSTCEVEIAASPDTNATFNSFIGLPSVTATKTSFFGTDQAGALLIALIIIVFLLLIVLIILVLLLIRFKRRARHAEKEVVILSRGATSEILDSQKSSSSENNYHSRFTSLSSVSSTVTECDDAFSSCHGGGAKSELSEKEGGYAAINPVYLENDESPYEDVEKMKKVGPKPPARNGKK
jgi:hypothetical protein